MEKYSVESKDGKFGSMQSAPNGNDMRLQKFIGRDKILKLHSCEGACSIATVMSKEQAVLWSGFSSAVRVRKIMNMPLVYGIVEGKNYVTLFTEKPTFSKITPDTHPHIFRSENTLIQIAMIYKTLNENSIFCTDVILDVIETTPFNLTFYDNQVGWYMKDLRYIILINPETEFTVDSSISEDHFLNLIQTSFITTDIPGLDNTRMYDSIAHLLISTCPENLSSTTLALLKTKKRTVTLSRISVNQVPGTLVLYDTGVNGEVYYGITMTSPDMVGEVKILTGCGIGHQTINPNLEIIEVPINQVFYVNSLISLPIGYYINNTGGLRLI